MNLIIGFAAVFWHIGQIALGRPAFLYLKDTPLTSYSFLLVFFATGVIRYCVVGDADFITLSISLLIQIAIYFGSVRWFLKIKPGYTMVAVLAGASVFVDSLATLLLLLGLSVDAIRMPFVVLDMGYAVLCVLSYNWFLDSKKPSKGDL